jgi:hypothetical protein
MQAFLQQHQQAVKDSMLSLSGKLLATAAAQQE